MKTIGTAFAAGLLVLTLGGGPLRAAGRESATVASATEVLRDLTALPMEGIPPALLQDAKGVAIIPHVIKAGFVVGGRYGRGVVLLRQPDGAWSSPVFVTLVGGDVGFQAGVQSTDIVLVFRTTRGLDRILSGRDKLTLGADLAVAAGPVGRQAEAGTDARLRAEIYSYSRSRGLFAGVSLEGAGILMDRGGNEDYYRVAGGQPTPILTPGAVPVPAEVVGLQQTLTGLSTPLAPAPVIYSPQPIVPPPVMGPPPLPPVPPPPAPLPR